MTSRWWPSYSAFYRLPLGTPEAGSTVVAGNPSFGYSEATRQFNMPPLNGTPEFTLFAGRSTIDSGIITVSSQNFPESFTDSKGDVFNENVFESKQQEDLTIDKDIGARLSIPLPSTANFNSTISLGLDYKVYQISTGSTNIFNVNGIEFDYTAGTTVPIDYQDVSPIPYTASTMDYAPMSVRYDANLQDASGVTAFGVGLEVNLWYQSQTITSTNGVTASDTQGAASLQQLTGSTDSHGHWVTITPSLSRTP